MKRFFKTLPIIFLLILALSLPVRAEPKAAEAYTVKVDTGYLALRSAPAYDASNELLKLYTGERFYVTIWLDGDYWYGYTETGVEGYVNKNYLIADSGYNIASNIRYTPDGGDRILETDHFSVQFPAYIDWDYKIVSNTALEIYYKPAKESGVGGTVVTIMAFDWGDNSYEDFPDWSLAGSGSTKKYIAVFPTDVRYDPYDQTQVKEYQELMEIAENMNCNDKNAYNLFKIK